MQYIGQSQANIIISNTTKHYEFKTKDNMLYRVQNYQTLKHKVLFNKNGIILLNFGLLYFNRIVVHAI